MTMFQVLHCADHHLDASFAFSRSLAPVGSWRRADLHATLGRSWQAQEKWNEMDGSA
jgi:hypothetical protein